jgi:hypothetical protein
VARTSHIKTSKVIVSPDIGRGWIVERTGPQSSIATCSTPTEAMEHALEEVALRGGELEVHTVDGQIDQRQTRIGKPRRRRANARR